MRSRRTPVRLLSGVLLAAALALSGCGSSSSSGSSSSGSGKLGLDSVKITGNVGSDPTVKFSGALADTSTTTKVLTAGTGPVIKHGDSVVLQTVIADGATQKTVASSYQEKAPSTVTMGNQVAPLFRKAIEGKTIGSRVVVYTPADQVYGPNGNPNLNIGNKDALLLIFDLVAKPLNGPNGAHHASPSWAPKVVTTKGVVSALDFAKTPKPSGQLRSADLRSGTGATVKKGQTIVVRYLGQVYKGKKPFDENFSKDPVSFAIGVHQVVSGWDKTLVGQKVGSEVVMAIPPKDGYGSKAQSGIPANSTLYFVVDILGAF